MGADFFRMDWEISEDFRAYFRDCFAWLSELPKEKFSSYLVDFPCLQIAEKARCAGRFTDIEVRDTLKQVGLNKSPRLMVYYKKYFEAGGARGVIVIVVGNEHGDTSSNPGRD